MVAQSKSSIIKPLNSGFTLIEMIIVLSIISIMASSLLLTYHPFTINDDQLFEDEYLTAQIKSLAMLQTTVVDAPKSNVSRLTFNELGNVNQAQTINLSQVDFVVQLGMGRYEKR